MTTSTNTQAAAQADTGGQEVLITLPKNVVLFVLFSEAA